LREVTNPSTVICVAVRPPGMALLRGTQSDAQDWLFARKQKALTSTSAA